MPSSRRRSGSVIMTAIPTVILGLTLSVAGCSSGDATGTASPAPAAPQGADPVAWVGAFCGGLSGVVAGAAALGNTPPTPQAQKEGLLAFADSSQRAMADTARNLERVGSPAIADGKRVHDTVVGFFRTAADSVAGQRAKLAELDPNDPQYVQKLSSLAGPDLGAASAQVQQLTSNPELMPAFRAAPECQRLGTGSQPR